MSLHNFDFYSEKFSTIDQVPDNRSEAQKRNSLLSQYNHGNPDVAYGERLSEEVINLSGAWVSLHMRLPNNDELGEAPLWEDDADPMYDNPKDFKAWFKPDPLEMSLTKWGVDFEVKSTFVFSRAVLLKEIGERLIVPGDVIEAPYNVPSFPDNPQGPKYFRVLNAAHIGNFRYRWLYIECDTELLTGDEALRPVLRGLNRGMPFVR